MTPEETPDLHFLADSRSLRQAITSFGCISAQVNTAHLRAAGRILWLRPLPDCLSAACGGSVLSKGGSPHQPDAELSCRCKETGELLTWFLHHLLPESDVGQLVDSVVFVLVCSED